MKTKAFLSLLLFIGLISLSPFEEGVAGTLQDVKARGKVIVGVKADYPPLGFLDKKGIHKGFDIDIAKALSKELFGNENAVEFVSVTSENRIPFLIWRKIDVIAATLCSCPEKSGLKNGGFATLPAGTIRPGGQERGQGMARLYQCNTYKDEGSG